MTDTEQGGVSPASAGGATAPDFNAIRDAVRGVPLWQLRTELAEIRKRAEVIETDRSTKATLLDRIRDVLDVEKTPAEPRRWRRGDPEPEIGTIVTWGTGFANWSRHEDGDWRSDACDCESCLDAVGVSWHGLLSAAATSGGLVEVVSTDG